MVREIDDDENIEFEEFLQLVKGGKKTKAKMEKHMDEETKQDSDIIFDFFKKLTNDELQNKDREQPFPLYYGAQRRRRILDAIMCEDGNVNKVAFEKKAAGEKILHNYRGSLEEMIKREKEEIRLMRE